ncbi:MAG: alpha-N-arabinofuranosidase, partial [Bacteroidales bacterium]|nr:alpha-N-arabinofuranosidase [Bacteroidales bacterium]
MRIISFIGKVVTLLFLGCYSAFSQNPIISDQFTADPSARVFNGKVYVFPSHDIPSPEGKGLREDWFCMEDYHVFSSKNLSEWIDHGMIVS